MGVTTATTAAELASPSCNRMGTNCPPTISQRSNQTLNPSR
ncbi:hypothetical protein OG866_14275 [Streptomyces sp. NBC_00663]|nr:hypothetical protein [Streptomyces sp. NBC_00663]